MTSANSTLILFEVMSLILISLFCVLGSRTGRKHGYWTFALFSFMESAGLMFRLALPLIRKEWIASTAVLVCHLAALMLLAAFAPVSRKWKSFWCVLLPLILLAGYRGLSLLPSPFSGYHIPDAVFTMASAIFASYAIWKCAMDSRNPGAVIPLKLSAVFLFAAALTTAAENISATVLDPRLTHLFAILRILCCLALAECIITRIRDTDFLQSRGRMILRWGPRIAMVLFLIPACFLPMLFREFGIRLESRYALEKAQDAGDDLRELVRRHDDFLNRQSGRSVISEMLKDPEQTLHQPSRLNGISLPGYSSQDTVLYLLDADGFCIDCSTSHGNLDFRGTDFSFRNYLKNASADGTGHELVAGKLTGRIVLCSARPVFEKDRKIGYLVVRTALEPVFRGLRSGYFALTLPDGTVLLSTPQWKIRYGSRRVAFPQKKDYFEESGHLLARTSCGVPGSDWYAVSCIPIHLPSMMYAIGQFCVILLWFCVFLGFRITLVHLKIRNMLEKNMQWRLSVFHGNAAGILVTDENRNIADVNDTLLRMFRCGKEEFRQHGLDLLHGDRESGRLFALQAYDAIEKTGKFESMIETMSPEGEEMNLRISGHSMSNRPEKNGRYSRASVWSIVDETLAIRRAKAVERYKEHYHKLLASTHAHIFICDPQGMFLESNDPEISNGIRRKKIFLPDYFEDSDAEFYRKVFSNVIASGKTISYHRNISFKGVVSERLDTVYPIRENGIVTEIGVISRDVVQLARAAHFKEDSGK